ncbi:hypothetical protein BJ878DRAFT_195333 [Calycina marina]|uniref:Uncharacterized protein n=1 Tax=Calycina marina TaxID=1763456 RepID=A0A9P8CCH5_9HELO|nr:hypothetical protein BJ878DRAFT_195333 [Calycina marina]
MIQRWVCGQSNKERLCLESLRTHTLLVLAYQSNNVSPYELWEDTGKLVRSAMIQSLHLDPGYYGAISLFDKEQRRRLWRSIVELNIQSSLAVGRIRVNPSLQEHLVSKLLLLNISEVIEIQGQLLQQCFATADGYRRCQRSVMGEWSSKTRLRWRWREL